MSLGDTFFSPTAYVVEAMFSSCLCVSVSVLSITCEWVDIETSFLVWYYILTICRSSLSIKVIGLRSRSSHGNVNFGTWTLV